MLSRFCLYPHTDNKEYSLSDNVCDQFLGILGRQRTIPKNTYRPQNDKFVLLSCIAHFYS